MSDRFLIAESVHNADVKFGGSEAQPGWENPKSRIALTVEAIDTRGEPIEVQIWLTIPQVASIVKMFFAPLLVREDNGQKTVFAKMLRRLLRKRWTTMSSPIATHSFQDDRWFPPYDNLEE